jgi:hypothetical protein
MDRVVALEANPSSRDNVLPREMALCRNLTTGVVEADFYDSETRTVVVSDGANSSRKDLGFVV